jgi:hypothetical protein
MTDRPPQLQQSYDRIPVIALTILGCIFCWWTWNRLGEVVFDFGHEVYVADQLAHGRILYRDLVYFFGPLPPTINAMAMRLTGLGVTAVRGVNLIVLAAAAVMIYRLISRIAGRYAAVVSTAVFLTSFAFGASSTIANFNFVTPYAHGATHGFLLCLGVVAMCGRLARTGRASTALMLGIVTGLVLLTKPEFFLSAAITAAMGTAAILWLRSWPDRRTPLMIVSFVIIGIVIGPAATWIWLCRTLPPRFALAVLGGWGYVMPTVVLRSPYYLWCLGLDNVSGNLLSMLAMVGIYLALIIPLAGLSILAGRRPAWKTAIYVGVALVWFAGITAGGIMLGRDNWLWVDAARGLPIACTGGVIALLWRIRRAKPLSGDTTDSATVAKHVTSLAIAVLALMSLTKMILNPRLDDYGFVLAAPGTLLCIAWVCGGLPRLMARYNANPTVIQVGGAAIALALISFRLFVTHYVLTLHQYPVELPGGVLLQLPYDAPSLQAAEWIRDHTAPTQTLAVLPDAAGLNFLAQRANSTPYDSLNPVEMAQLNESTVIDGFRRHPPDLILIVDQDYSSEGGKTFGVDYGQNLMHWIDQQYQPIPPFNGPAELPDARAARVLLRRDLAQPANDRGF